MKKIHTIWMFFISISTMAQVTADGGYFETSGTRLEYRTNDADNGDGSNDGCIYVRPLSTTQGIGTSYYVNGFMDTSQTLSISTVLFNSNASYVGVKVELFNVNDNIILATNAVGIGSGEVKTVNLSYTPIGTDQGDELAIRFLRNDDGNTSRLFNIDLIQINGDLAILDLAEEVLVKTTTSSWKEIGDATLNIDNDINGTAQLNVNTSISGQGAIYLFKGRMFPTQSISISTNFYNPSTSVNISLNVELYNSSDNQVISSQSYTLVPEQTQEVTFTHTPVYTEKGDKLMLRYIRTDAGNIQRIFSINNIQLNGTYAFLVPCGWEVNKDLPLLASNTVIDADIDTIIDRLTVEYASSPVDAFLDSANQAYEDELGISIIDGEINGNPLTQFNSPSRYRYLFIWSRHLYHNPTNTIIANKFNNAVWWITQQYCEGKIQTDNLGYNIRNVLNPIIISERFLDDNVKSLFSYLLYEHLEEFKHLWEPVYDTPYQVANRSIDTDVIHNKATAMLGYVAWIEGSDNRYQYMRGVQRYLERFATYTAGGADGIKNDGAGFHHAGALDNYMYALHTASNLYNYMVDTQFELSSEGYKRFRNAIYNQLVISNDNIIKVLSATGRSPNSRNTTSNQASLKKIAIMGGKILDLPTADPVIAGLYNRLFGVDSSFNYNTVADKSEMHGFFQQNSGTLAVIRNDDWVAVAKGFGNTRWAAEMHPSSNRYGRYFGYGTFEILYPGDVKTGNGYDVKTWDWNYHPGATVRVLEPAELNAEVSIGHELQQKSFVGALSFENKGSVPLTKIHGSSGIFAMDFQEGAGSRHNPTFTFKKSIFSFDDIIVRLGSNINNDDATNKTATVLYQRIDNNTNDVIVDGTVDNSNNIYNSNTDHWILNNYNTGFYIVKDSGDLSITQESQQTINHNQQPTTDISGNENEEYAIGILDHGMQPTDAAYEYIIMPSATAQEMSQLATSMSGSNKPYEVIQKDQNAHILHHISKSIYGYAIFEPNQNFDNSGLVTSTDHAALLMYRGNGDETILMSITQPDSQLEYLSREDFASYDIQVTLKGEWEIEGSNSNVNSVNFNGVQTAISFHIDKGLPVEQRFKNVVTATWTGAVDTDWATVGNWSTGMIPISTNDVTIPSGPTHQPIIGATTGAAVNNLAVDSGASLSITSGGSLIVNGTSSGNITYNIAIVDTNWHLVSPPVVGEQYDNAWVTANSIAISGSGNRGISTYDNGTPHATTKHWRYFAGGTTETFNSGVGYSNKRTVAGNYSFTGTFPTADVFPTISQNDQKWSLIGNPYPSYIDVSAFLTANTSNLQSAYQAIYIWNGTAYTDVTTGYICPGQGFFVYSNIASGTASITETMQSHQTGVTFYRSSSVPTINLMLSDGTNSKETQINYPSGKTRGLDPRFDIGMFDGVSSNLRIYTHLLEDNQGIPFSRQALPNADLESMIIPIGVKAETGKEITFSVNALNLPTDIKVFIEDKVTNTFTRLDEIGSNYTITLSETMNGVGRFYLRTSINTLTINDVNLENVSIYKSDAFTITIAGLKDNRASLKLFTLLGKQVLSTSFKIKGIENITLPKLASGIYIVQLQTDSGKLNKKMIIE